jgi:hypothetical protein
MKISFKMELIGDDERQYMRAWSHMKDDMFGRLMGSHVIGTNPNVPWVAEIVGLSEKYCFERIFLKFKKDYAQSNSKGSRGVYAWYLLETGKCYEIKERVTWKRWERYFVTTNNDGSYQKLDKEEVFEWLKDQSA